MTKCVYCGFQSERPEGYRRNFCDSCVQDKEIGIGYVKETVVIGSGYKTTKARLDELERRVILPYKGEEKGDYFVGRRNEKGGISEKEPEYR